LTAKGTRASPAPPVRAPRLTQAAAHGLARGRSLQQGHVGTGAVEASKQPSGISPSSSSCQKNHVLCQEAITEEQIGVCHKWQQPKSAGGSRDHLSQESGNGDGRMDASAWCFEVPSGAAASHCSQDPTGRANPSRPLLCCPPPPSAARRGYLVGQVHAHRPPPPPPPPLPAPLTARADDRVIQAHSDRQQM